MPTTVNGKTVYTTRTSGTSTYFIQLGSGTVSDPYVGLTATDKAYLDAAETAAAAVPTPLKTYLEGQTHSATGRNAWEVYGGLEQVYNTADNDVVIKSAAAQSAATIPSAAPAGGTGAAAGGWDTASNRDAAITTINSLRTAVSTLQSEFNTLTDLVNALRTKVLEFKDKV